MYHPCYTSAFSLTLTLLPGESRVSSAPFYFARMNREVLQVEISTDSMIELQLVNNMGEVVESYQSYAPEYQSEMGYGYHPEYGLSPHEQFSQKGHIEYYLFGQIPDGYYTVNLICKSGIKTSRAEAVCTSTATISTGYMPEMGM